MDCVPVSVAIPSYRNAGRLIETIDRIRECVPPPAEVLVYIDNSDRESQRIVQRRFPDMRVVLGPEHLGPGGGRNHLVDIAAHDLIASFDDDSWPLETDYFARVVELFGRHDRAGVLAAAVVHPGEEKPEHGNRQWVADFVGCGAVYRREAFLDAGGYVPLPVAYGMEEADLALRLIAQSWCILYDSDLVVYHDTDRSNQSQAHVVSASLVNLGLLAYLRYPCHLWWIGAVQFMRKWVWYIQNGRRKGLVRPFFTLPGVLWRHRGERTPLPGRVLKRYFRLRRSPQPVK